MATLATAPAGKHKRRTIPLHIDMTPMVDLAFLLLTFFVMTTSLMKSYKIDLDMPSTNNDSLRPPIVADRVLNLIVGKNNDVYWYIGSAGSPVSQVSFSKNGVRKLLLEKNNEIKNVYVLIKVADASRYQNMIDILDEMTITGITRYSMVELEAEDERLIQQSTTP